jgi:hypothetical protein
METARNSETSTKLHRLNIQEDGGLKESKSVEQKPSFFYTYFNAFIHLHTGIPRILIL